MADKVLQVQVQARRNAEELSDYMRDLVNWQREMQAKDRQLLRQKRGLTAAAPVPPDPDTSDIVQEEESLNPSPPGADLRSGPAGANGPPSGSSKIKAYEYEKWDKFDVDKACEEVDSNGLSAATMKAPARGAAAVQEGLSPEVLRQQAVVEKEKGNQFFKGGKYKEAVECYTKGMLCDPANAAIAANRAMAYLKQEDLSSAEADCTLALSLDPSYVKAYQRRATARTGLKRINEAIWDFSKVLDLEPSNKQAKVEIEKLRSKLEAAESSAQVESKVVQDPPQPELKEAGNFQDNLKKAFQSSKADKEKSSGKLVKPEPVSKVLSERAALPGQVFPIKKEPHQRSKKPLKSIEIREVGDVVVHSEPRLMNRSSDEFLIREFATTTNATSIEKNQDKVSSTPVASNGVVEERLERRPVIEEISTEIEKDPGISESIGQGPSKSRGHVRTVEDSIIQEHLKKAEESDGCSGSQEAGALKRKKHARPASSIAFYSTWRTLAEMEDRLEFLDTLTPQHFPSVFRQSLEPQVFDQIVDTLHTALDAVGGQGNNCVGRVAAHVLGLSKVPRVSALAMFLGSKERAKLDEIVTAVTESNPDLLPEADRQSIIQAFLN